MQVPGTVEWVKTPFRSQMALKAPTLGLQFCIVSLLVYV